jgi:hypothetical protein
LEIFNQQNQLTNEAPLSSPPLLKLQAYALQTAARMIRSISFSSPDIVRILAPTVTVALVNTVSTLRIAERFTLTHKEYANKPIYTQPAFQFFLRNRQVTSTQAFQGLLGK